jgi:hypothetical protein
MRRSKEFNNFDLAMDQILKVPHSEIKKKLDAEKEEKRKRKAAKKTTGRAASRDSDGGT